MFRDIYIYNYLLEIKDRDDSDDNDSYIKNNFFNIPIAIAR